jgi:hypothetical protein
LSGSNETADAATVVAFGANNIHGKGVADPSNREGLTAPVKIFPAHSEMSSS